jgi:hypothetical protein
MLTKNTDKLRREVAAHVASDSIIQGDYWSEKTGKGCFIGCLAHSNEPKINEATYGLPVMVQRIAESIFEGLPLSEAKAFFAALPDAVGCDGKDLIRVVWQFLAAELQAMPEQNSEVQAVIDPVIAGMNLLASGKEWPDAAASAAACGACISYLAKDIADYNAYYTAVNAISAAAYAALSYTSNAFNYVAETSDFAAARTDPFRLRQRDLLLKLITESPVVRPST